MTREPAEYFRAAACRFFYDKKIATQKSVGINTGISPSEINDIVKGRAAGKEEKRRKIAEELGYRYEEFLAIGRMVLEGKPEEEIEKTASVLRHRPGTHQVTNEFPIGAQGVTEAPITWQHGGALREIDKRFLTALHQLNPRDYSVVLEFINSLAQTSPYPQHDKVSKKTED